MKLPKSIIIPVAGPDDPAWPPVTQEQVDSIKGAIHLTIEENAIAYVDSPAFKVDIMKPEGPIKWEGFDANGNYGRIYENGCETWISKEILADDQIPYSPGI